MADVGFTDDRELWAVALAIYCLRLSVFFG